MGSLCFIDLLGCHPTGGHPKGEKPSVLTIRRCGQICKSYYIPKLIL